MYVIIHSFIINSRHNVPLCWQMKRTFVVTQKMIYIVWYLTFTLSKRTEFTHKRAKYPLVTSCHLWDQMNPGTEAGDQYIRNTQVQYK